MIKLFIWIIIILFGGIVMVNEVAAIKYGVILPYTSFGTRVRTYQRQLNVTWAQLVKAKNLLQNIEYETATWPIVPTPTKILDTLCVDFLPKGVSVIIYVTNSEFYNEDVMATQYFLQLANYIGLPVIAWNAANVGLEKNLPNSVILQLAPTVSHQADAMLAIVVRYEWNQFCVFTSFINGNEDFIQSLREGVDDLKQQNDSLKLEMLDSLKLKVREDEDAVLRQLHSANGLCRIFLLYSTNFEARLIFKAAKKAKLTGKDFTWIVTQSIVATTDYTPELPVGLLGIHFNSGHDGILKACANAVRVLTGGLQSYLENDSQTIFDKFDFSCNERSANKSTQGYALHNHLRNVSILSEWNEDRIQFNHDGTLRQTTLQIVNLDSHLQWQTVGHWKDKVLNIKDIVWSGGFHFPPIGRPEKFHMKVTFLEEPPYLNMEMPDPITGRCRTSAADICTVPAVEIGTDITGVGTNVSHQQCCSGFTVDLLQKLSKDLQFSYDLKRVEDGRWGTQIDGKWNGLVSELLEKKADMVMTSLKINSQREEAVAFSLPFLETGIAVAVAKKTGIVSPHAFLQPFDPITWFVITIVAIQAGALSIFFFEWLSPAGLNRTSTLPKDHNFTLFQTYWLAWAMLFKAPVHTVGPKGCTSRCMANFWAAFAVVFIAIYTANLAVFMITREMYYDFTGVEDERLSRPMSRIPPFRYGTIPSGNTETVIKNNFNQMYLHMRQFNRSTVFEGIKAVKSGELDAFIYDATVLDYLAGQDDDCGLLTVGSWYSMTGYGVAFPKQSKYIDMFSQQILAYKHAGQLEQWQKFWLSGACRTRQDDSQDHLQGFGYQALSFEQFISAFVLLALGIILSFIIFIFEHCSFCYVSKVHHSRSSSSRSKWWTLISQNVSRLLQVNAEKAVKVKCNNPRCDLELWKTRRELDLAKMRVELLETKIEEIKLQFIQGTLL